MVSEYKQRILTHLTDARYRPRKAHELADDLGVPPDQLEGFERAVRGLIDAGQVVLGSSDTLSMPPPGRDMVGVFRLNARGFGFLVPESQTEHGDLFVPAGKSAGALTGDLVRARVVHEPGRARAGRSPYTGRIVEVLKRADRQYVGSVEKMGRAWVVVADGRILPDPIVIRDPHAKGAKPGSKVVVELIAYPTGDAPPQGVIVEVLGPEGEPDVETAAVIRAFGLREPFPKDALAQARNAAHAFGDGHDRAQRLDLTQRFIVTIDPPDAKDYDDAISIDRLDPAQQPDGAAWELGVHIADVARFVTPASALDTEARARGNSTYLPRRVVPMLPELLSNGVCSLQEAVPRWCKSAFIRYDAAGRVLAQRVANTKIKSAKRLTYLEAQALIDGQPPADARVHGRSESNYPPNLVPTLRLMDELARTLRKRRLAEGMIVLDLPEVDLVFDDDGHVTDALPEDNAFTHTLIEMFMVEANEAVARLFDSLNVPMIRRIHADPDAHDLTDLRRFTRVAGFRIPERPSRRDLQRLLDAVRGKPAQHAVHLAVLKTLSKAEYSPALVGHFALASTHYTHFTSPIRRYADLVVHRALEAYLDLAAHDGLPGGRHARNAAARLTRALTDDDRCPDEATLTDVARHCSATERNSEAAERHLRDVLVLQLLGRHLGDDFEGTVTGVAAAGLFVQIDRYLVDGFIPAEELVLPGPGGRGDRWRFDRRTGSLVASPSGRSVTLGERFIVRVAKVDPPSRKLDLLVVGAIGTPGGKTTGKLVAGKIAKPAKARQTPRQPSRQPASKKRTRAAAQKQKKKKKRRG